jgi:hypothetical protein
MLSEEDFAALVWRLAWVWLAFGGLLVVLAVAGRVN